MNPRSVLFLCVSNRARSQMAEALARHILPDAVTVQSAGSNPSRPHPMALTVLHEAGIPTDGLRSKHVDTIDPEGVDLVITLCAEESCPLFLSNAPRRSWAMPDPDQPSDDEPTALARFRDTRDAIRARIEALATELGEGH